MKAGRLLIRPPGPLGDSEGFYGAPPLARVRDYSPDGVRSSLEASLRRLSLDRIDVALIHDPDDHAHEALDAAYPALAQLGEFPPLDRPFNLADFEQASALDGVRFVLDHGAKPDMASGCLEPWARLIAELARRPTIVCKLSGLVTEAGAG